MTSLDEILERAIPLSQTPLSSIAIRALRCPFKIQEKHGRKGRTHYLTSVFFSVHSGTHLDLPYCIDWKEVRDDGDYQKLYGGDTLPLEPDKRREILKPFLRVAAKPCLILNLEQKKKIVEGMKDDRSDPSLRVEVLRNDLDQRVFTDVYKRLEITEEEIGDIIEKNSLDLKDHIVVFRTDWNEYATFVNLSEDIWNCWHLYLTHPYIRESTVKFLLEKQIAGLGTDTPDFDEPLSYFVKKATHQPYIDEELIRNLPSYRPVHTLAHKSRLYMIEGMINLNKIDLTNNEFAKGTLLICPFLLGGKYGEYTLIEDGLPASLYFLPESARNAH